MTLVGPITLDPFTIILGGSDNLLFRKLRKLEQEYEFLRRRTHRGPEVVIEKEKPRVPTIQKNGTLEVLRNGIGLVRQNDGIKYPWKVQHKVTQSRLFRTCLSRK